MEYHCNICNKLYSSYQSLWIHNKKFHNNNGPKKSEKSEKQSENAIVYPCRKCEKIYHKKNSRWSHEQVCKNINNNIMETNINSKNNICNINSNNKQYITINQIGNEPMSSLSIDDILRIIRDGNNGPISCIKKLNFNKNKPENHSFCTTTLEGKHFTKINHKTQKPEKINKRDFIDQILLSSLTFIENINMLIEFDDEFKNKIPIKEQEQIKEILNNKNKFYEIKNKKAFFNCINDMSYNFKDLILSTWKLLQPNIDDDELLFDENFNYYSSDDD
jgi:hypothetical protein